MECQIFLSPAWSRHVEARFRAVDLPRFEVVVHYRANTSEGPVLAEQVFAGGRLRRWRIGASQSPDLILEQERPTFVGFALRRGARAAAVCGTRIVEAHSSAPTRSLLSPFDELRPSTPELNAQLPGATGVVHLNVTDTLVGSCDFIEEWVDGRRTRFECVDRSELRRRPADVSLRLTSLQLTSLRVGAIAGRDLIAGGAGVTGTWPSLMMFAGLYEEPSLRASWLLGSPTRIAQARLGAILWSGPYTEAIADVAAVSSDGLERERDEEESTPCP